MGSIWMKGWKWPYVVVLTFVVTAFWSMGALFFWQESNIRFGKEFARFFARFDFACGALFFVALLWGVGCIFRERDYVKRLGGGLLVAGAFRLLALAIGLPGVLFVSFSQVGDERWAVLGTPMVLIGVIILLITLFTHPKKRTKCQSDSQS